MNVIYFLTPVVPAVKDKTVAVLCEAFLTGDIRGGQENVPCKFLVVFLKIVHRWNRFLGNDQDMGGSLGLDIPKGKDKVILVDFVTGNFPVDDLGKNCLGHEFRSFPVVKVAAALYACIRVHKSIPSWAAITLSVSARSEGKKRI